MNAKRRKEIERAIEKLEEVKSLIETVREDEECAYDNLPGGIQDSERGERMQEAMDYLDDMLSSIEDAMEYANEIVS